MIETSGLTFCYRPDSGDVLKEIRVTLSDRSFTVVMGSNGSGKSTLARCLNGLLMPTQGTVSVDGMRTDDPSTLIRVRRRVGLVFQDPNLQMTSTTIERELAFGLENIGIPSEEMHTRVDEYLRTFGFESRRCDPPSSLSAGERQRLAIASVLILQPSWLILDEATSLLGARSRSSILQMILKLRQAHQMGIILITQFPSEALLGERLIVMHQGQCAFDDVPEKVFRNSEALVRMGVAIPLKERLRMIA